MGYASSIGKYQLGRTIGEGTFAKVKQVITNKAYEGAAADVWSCGVILYELLAGYLPFDDLSLVHLYRKGMPAEYFACVGIALLSFLVFLRIVGLISWVSLARCYVACPLRLG